MTPRDLPIYELENEIVASLAAQPRLILQAPTGSGKSTQVPQILLDHGLLGDGEVVILQPRRLATRLLARASRLNGAAGSATRSVIRFGSKRSSRKRPGSVLSPKAFSCASCSRIPSWPASRRFFSMNSTSAISTATSRSRALCNCKKRDARPEAGRHVGHARVRQTSEISRALPGPHLERSRSSGQDRIPDETSPGRELSDLGPGGG